MIDIDEKTADKILTYMARRAGCKTYVLKERHEQSGTFKELSKADPGLFKDLHEANSIEFQLFMANNKDEAGHCSDDLLCVYSYSRTKHSLNIIRIEMNDIVDMVKRILELSMAGNSIICYNSRLHGYKLLELVPRYSTLEQILIKADLEIVE